ncbi:NAD(P)/FAD-dependent oxidoreductase [Blastopirellula sp. JC732]|uniref:NAD(P)/FAD-dependent oxidoreductase n=1 Tax=Blastopirellula sediminis TaxID=2894196 RepID=A0A9X1MSQ7_9BACT|nr:NAD(P)/FAD-dependent oxidoreductase [Blastopirellula sediminis]MCC9604884.1 NAD(P)/FAD-dependent oxidoreductase [Blastopirellula sediminis]MCC9631817.1 NAD(P)/FAD-dependent oxidoreductase [Blastopirellula sediminis]
MSVDAPAKITILGAGPIGLEAALYARFLGYEVAIYEQGRPAESIRRWGSVPMFSPFGMNSSPLARSALSAQFADELQLPGENELLTGAEYVERYLQPLADSDLLADSLHCGWKAVAVGREGLSKSDMVDEETRRDADFIVVLQDSDGREQIDRSDVLIDCTGLFGQAAWIGSNGVPATGEVEARPHVEFGLPDILGDERDKYAGKHTLVIGSGYSAATNVCALGQLAREALHTQVTWITRKDNQTDASGPMRRFTDDPLSARDCLAVKANGLAADSEPHVTHWPNAPVTGIHYDAHSDRFQVTLAGKRPGVHEYDRVIANVGYVPNVELTRSMQIHYCYATEGPIKLAAKLMENASSDCMAQPPGDAQLLINPEPDFYVLGAKSYGRNSQFLIKNGLEQIRQLFTIIGDRENLDLYRQFLPANPQ